MEQRKHHLQFPPSSLDALVKCPFYKSGPSGEAAQKGTDQHTYAEALLRKDAKAIEESSKKLTADDRDNCQWYADYVNANASGELEIEQSLELIGKNFEPITFGTIDTAASSEIWDYKSDREERVHFYQMAAYALMQMQHKKLPQVTAHICYGKLRKVVSLTFTEAEAWSAIEKVLAIYHNPDRSEMPNEYCGWCSKILTCPAMQRHVDVVAARYAPEDSDKIQCWNPSEVSDPRTVGRMLTIARIVGPWANAVEEHAKIMLKGNNDIPGWTIMERQGARKITDITKAFALTGLSEAAFLKCCNVKVGELEEVYAAEKGVKKAEAKRTLKDLLAEVTEQKKPYALLVRQKEA
jgi:hypothetical protein